MPRQQGSWVSLTWSPKGQLYTCDQYGALYQVTLENTAVAVKKISLPIGSAQGLLWAFDALYVIGRGEGSGKGSGLFRLTDEDSDGSLD